MNQNKGIWVGAVSLVVIAALGLWWLAANRPLGPLSSLIRSDEPTSSSSSTATVASTTNTKKTTVSKITKKNQDVATIVRGLSSASTFNTYFRSSGIAATINPKSTSKYTIFVPTNGAFAQLPPGTVSSMSTAEKKRLIQYHVVSGRAVDVDAMTAGSIQALSGDMLNFSYGNDKIPMVNSAIVVAQYEGTNGVVVVIDNVLLPPKR